MLFGKVSIRLVLQEFRSAVALVGEVASTPLSLSMTENEVAYELVKVLSYCIDYIVLGWRCCCSPCIHMPPGVRPTGQARAPNALTRRTHSIQPLTRSDHPRRGPVQTPHTSITANKQTWGQRIRKKGFSFRQTTQKSGCGTLSTKDEE